MKTFDAFLSGIKIYRRLRGDIWRQFRFKPIPYLVGWFRNSEPTEAEIVEAVEDYR